MDCRDGAALMIIKARSRSIEINKEDDRVRLMTFGLTRERVVGISLSKKQAAELAHELLRLSDELAKLEGDDA